MAYKQQLMNLFKYKIGNIFQHPSVLDSNPLESDAKRLLDSCHVYFRCRGVPRINNILEDCLRQAAEESKSLIDDLVNNACEQLNTFNYKPCTPDLLKIECPVCKEHSPVISVNEVCSVITGITFDSWFYEPIDQDIYDYSSDVRQPEYYCDNCGAPFDSSKINDLVEEYNLKHRRPPEEDIDIFEGFKANDQQK